MYLTLCTIMNYSAGSVTFSGQFASLNHIIPITEKLREILAIAIYHQTVLRGGAQKRQAHCIWKGTGLAMPAICWQPGVLQERYKLTETIS